MTSESGIEKVSEKIRIIHDRLRSVKSLMTEIMRDITWIESTLDRHSKKTEEISVASSSRKPTGLAVPIRISGELCEFMNVPLESLVSRVAATRAVHSYIKTNQLQDPTNKKVVLPDACLGNLLQTTEPVPYLVLQKHLKHHFLKEEKEKEKEKEKTETREEKEMPVSELTDDGDYDDV
jgi:chromatin remodeling complex protein RSC6